MSIHWSVVTHSLLLSLCWGMSPNVSAQVLPATGAANDELSYRSQPGDHLTGIARRLLVGGASANNLRELIRLNGLRQPDLLPLGTTLRLPPARLRYDATSAKVLSADAATRADGSAISAGQTLQAGDSLATGPSGGVVLELANGTKVLIRPSSQVRLERLRSATDFDHSDSALSLSRGGVEAQVSKARGGTRFEVRSPVATLGVRGTSFRAALGETGESRVEVLTGLVGATGSADAKAADVSAGFGVVVDRSGRAGEVVALLPAPALSALPARVETVTVRFPIPPVAAAAGYRGEVFDRATRRSLASAQAVAGLLSFQGLPDGDYELVVRALGSQGLEGLDASHAFALRARPVAPLPLAPRAAARLWGEMAALSWAAAPDAQRYRAQVVSAAPGGTAVAPAASSGASVMPAATTAVPVVDQIATTTALSASLPPGSYLWRVASIDANGRQGPFGVTRAFMLSPAPAALPPAALGETSIELSWASEPGAGYDVQIARDSAFGQMLLERRVATPSLSFDRPAPGRYSVRVRPVVTGDELAPWSPVQTIDLPAPPPPPPPPQPAPTWPWLLLIPLLLLL